MRLFLVVMTLVQSQAPTIAWKVSLTWQPTSLNRVKEFYFENLWSWDVLTVGATIAVVKLAVMAWYFWTD